MGPKYVEAKAASNLSEIPLDKLEKELIEDYDRLVKKAKAKGLEPAPFTLVPKGKRMAKIVSPLRGNGSLLKDTKDNKSILVNPNTPSYSKPFGSRSTRGSVGFKNTTKLKQYDKLDTKYSTLDTKQDGHKIEKFREIVSKKQAKNDNNAN